MAPVVAAPLLDTFPPPFPRDLTIGFSATRDLEPYFPIRAGAVSKQGKLQGGPAPFEPIQSISGFGFDSSRRDGDELFSGGEVCLAATLMPYVRDSAQFFDR